MGNKIARHATTFLRFGSKMYKAWRKREINLCRLFLEIRKNNRFDIRPYFFNTRARRLVMPAPAYPTYDYYLIESRQVNRS